MIGHRLQQRIHQHHIDHGGLVDHEEITIERVFLILAEATCLGIDLEKTMDRLGLVSGRLGHPFCRASGWRA